MRERVSQLRVVIVAASLDILGGQGVQAALLLDALRGDGIDARLLPINPRFPAWLATLRRRAYVRTIVNELLYLPTLLSLSRADVVHVFSASYWSFLLAPVPAMLVGRILGKRVVLHYHSGEAADHLQHWGPLVHPWLRLADEIVVPSPYLRDVFAAHGYSVRVIPNIVKLADFTFRDRTPLAPNFLSMRNLEPYYRVDVILRSFATIKSAWPAATLTVAGYGSEERTLRRLAAELGVGRAVRFVGRVEPVNVPALFDSADIFLNASVLDNQPVSILEAFAAGTPVITTGAGDIPSMVSHGETGWIVPMKDAVALADAALELLANLEGAGQVARRAHAALERYTWSSVRDMWADVYAATPSATDAQPAVAARA